MQKKKKGTTKDLCFGAWYLPVKMWDEREKLTEYQQEENLYFKIIKRAPSIPQTKLDDIKHKKHLKKV